MNYNHFRIVVVLLLGALLFTYTNCGQPFGGPSELVFKSNVYGGGSEASYSAFERSVYPITRSNCISCHSSIQPLHASDDMKEAHDALISQFKVNFANIPASRIVAKLRDENHNCWSDCSENAAEMQAAIEEWKSAIESSGAATSPSTLTLETSETSTLEEEFNDPSNPLKSNTIRLNMEAAMLRAPMGRFTSGSDVYLSVPNSANTVLSSTDANAGIAYFTFSVPVDGQYRVWGHSKGDSSSDNSFYVNVLEGTRSLSGGTRSWDFTPGSAFQWRQVPNVAPNLISGRNYTIEVRQREDGAKLAGIIVTSDPEFNGQEVDDHFGITLSFDLSSLLKTQGVSLLIDVIDFDPYSYKFSNPRIETTSASVYVKGLKLLVNDAFSPQHSTYTVVDKIATPTDGQLSTYSMIVLKDKGLSGDRIKFSFDQLSLASSPSTGTTGGTTGGGTTPTQTSLTAFQATVYPVSRSSAYSCVGCHTSVSPRHASDNTLTAHDAALTVVDFTNPSNSRIVRKMRIERHNCQAYCDSIASEYENAITDWRNRGQ